MSVKIILTTCTIYGVLMHDLLNEGVIITLNCFIEKVATCIKRSRGFGSTQWQSYLTLTRRQES